MASGGGVYRWSLTRAQGAGLGEPRSTLRLEPSTLTWTTFSCTFFTLPPTQTPTATPTRVMVIGAPPWAILLAPTLLALGVSNGRRAVHQRRQNRERARGRTPCPTCNYDATNLTTCPECGTTMNPDTETQT